MKKIVFIPVDERPCNYKFPQQLAKAINDFEFVAFPSEKLGHFRNPTKFEDIKEFLLKECRFADILILPIEMLLYGGLIPSRNHFLSKEELLNRLFLIKELKKINPNLKIYSFTLIMRCPTYNGSDEEPEYYFNNGEDIFNYGVLVDKYNLGLISKNEYEQQLKIYDAKIGKYLKDYISRRELNLSVLLETLKLANKEIDYLAIPIDDSSEFGFTAIDKKKVLKELDRLHLHIPMYPGSDEVCMTLVAKAISDYKNYKIKVKCVFPKPECAKSAPMYEDRPIGETLKLQLEVSGFEPVESNEDVVLYMNYPVHSMVNMGSTPSSGYAERDMDSFNKKIINDVKSGKKVLLCDGAYGNGGEKEFLMALQKEISLFDVVSYAGWNTSSNTLGTVLYQGTINYFYPNKKVNDNFIANRIYEDICYCGAVRWDVWHNDLDKFGANYYNVGVSDGPVAKLVNEKMNIFAKETFPELYKKFKIIKCEFPWNRIFEIDLESDYR